LVRFAEQWSPYNKDGKKKYERDFLMQLQYDSQSLRRPEDLPKLDVVIDTVNIISQYIFIPSLHFNDDKQTVAKLEFLIIGD